MDQLGPPRTVGPAREPKTASAKRPGECLAVKGSGVRIPSAPPFSPAETSRAGSSGLAGDSNVEPVRLQSSYGLACIHPLREPIRILFENAGASHRWLMPVGLHAGPSGTAVPNIKALVTSKRRSL